MNFQDELAKRTEETEKVIRSFLPAEAGFAGTMAQLQYAGRRQAPSANVDPGDISPV